jgi:hypothetical protein
VIFGSFSYLLCAKQALLIFWPTLFGLCGFVFFSHSELLSFKGNCICVGALFQADKRHAHHPHVVLPITCYETWASAAN